MTDAALDDDAGDLAFDVIGMRRGIVGGVVGVDDWDMSRMRDAKEIILVDFGGRQQAYAGVVGFQRASDMRLSDALKRFDPGCTIVLGSGEAPPPHAPFPYMYRMLAPHGFKLDNIRLFEWGCDVIEDELWNEAPPCRTPKEAGNADVELDHANAPPLTEGRAGRLKAAPPLEPEQGRRYTEPMFRVEVRAFPRKLREGSWGTDKDGNPWYMNTHVKPQTRFKDKDEKPEGTTSADLRRLRAMGMLPE